MTRPYQGAVLLIGWKFSSTNQKHYPDTGSDASLVWNFCSRFSDVISRGNQWWVALRNVGGCFIKTERKSPFLCVSKRPILYGFVQCRLRALFICQNWPAGPLRQFENEIGFFQEFLLENHLLRAYYLGFDWSGWKVLIKSEVVIATGMVSSVSSDKWKAPLASDFALCALKIIPVLHYHSLFTAAPSRQGKIHFPNFFPHSLSQSICPYYKGFTV